MKTKILMVCLGNICRSPLAEGMLKSKLNSDKFIVDSAGTNGFHNGERPDIRSIEIATINKIDISNQRSRQIKKSDFLEFDYIYVMDSSNYNDVLNLTSSDDERRKIKLILNESHPNKNLEVPDPYYGGKDGFVNVFNLLDDACESIKQKLTTDDF